ncbi:MAG: BspA family leucine-rich repeat surface protein, partial [Oleispira sp.]|nr:BspA family leucine-rich repeat surface protein [Oleispira sp.]
STEKFNSDVSGWNIETVTNMEGMFVNSKSFDQDISGWDVTKVTNCADFKTNSVLSDAHTPDILHCATPAP